MATGMPDSGPPPAAAVAKTTLLRPEASANPAVITPPAAASPGSGARSECSRDGGGGVGEGGGASAADSLSVIDTGPSPPGFEVKEDAEVEKQRAVQAVVDGSHGEQGAPEKGIKRPAWVDAATRRREAPRS